MPKRATLLEWQSQQEDADVDEPLLRATEDTGRSHARTHFGRSAGACSFPWGMTLLVCFVAFFVNCQPSEPFLSQYLQEDKNLTETQLDEVVWPVDTYATLAFFLPVAFAAEVFGYAPVIVCSLLCREATRIILIYSQGLVWMTVTQGTYALASIGNSVLLSYLYQHLPQSMFARAALLFQAMYHLGNFIGSVTGQLLVDHANYPIARLFYVSWACTSVGFVLFVISLVVRWRHRNSVAHISIWHGDDGDDEHDEVASRTTCALSDPNAPGSDGSAVEDESQYKHVRSRSAEVELHTLQGNVEHRAHRDAAYAHEDASKIVPGPESLIASLRRLTWKRRLTFFWQLYLPLLVALWSMWWVFAYGANLLFGNYYQTLLYNEFSPSNDSSTAAAAFPPANGATSGEVAGQEGSIPFGWIEGGLEVAGVVGNLGLFLVANRASSGVASPFVAAALLATASVLLQFTWGHKLPVMVALLCFFKCVYSGSLSLARASIASHLQPFDKAGQRYALVYLTNGFVALAVNTAVSAVATSAHATTRGFFRVLCGLCVFGAALLAVATPLLSGRRMRREGEGHVNRA